MAAKKLIIILVLLKQASSFSFCGFFVSKAGTNLFNKASKVVIARDNGKTVLTMSNDFQGEIKEFAMVIPVPEILERGQINVASNSLIEHLDNYTAPRLVEYNDEDPCKRKISETLSFSSSSTRMGMKRRKKVSPKKLGVTIEAKYTVGEYDILILSAKESSGLVTWLKQEKYKIPKGAQEIIGSYLKQGMKFFVAKVNLEKQSKLGFNFLRPIQVAYSSPKFMLPIRLGMLNAKEYQDLFIFTLTKKGRVETTNYRTKKLPSNIEIPTYIKSEFSKFYIDMFDHQVRLDGMKSVWLEYAWDMNWCDPCAASPLSNSELKQLGVFWMKKNSDIGVMKSGLNRIMPRREKKEVFVSRLHIRYNKERFPDDLKLQITGDKENFQGRYILRNKWSGSSSCSRADEYREKLPIRLSKEARNLSNLTGRDIDKVRSRLNIKPAKKDNKSDKWWSKLWTSI